MEQLQERYFIIQQKNFFNFSKKTFQEILASLLQCDVKVDVAMSSSREKRIVDESSLSEQIFQHTKKHEKFRETKISKAIRKVFFPVFTHFRYKFFL